MSNAKPDGSVSYSLRTSTSQPVIGRGERLCYNEVLLESFVRQSCRPSAEVVELADTPS
jgi:hypothetical protein